MLLLSLLIKNKLILIALAAIPFLILFLSLNDKAQKKIRRPAVQQLAYQQTQADTTNQTSIISGVPESPKDRALEKIEHRIPLSQKDFYAKNKILELVPPDKPSGIVYQSDKATVEYIASTDTFQSEILTTDIALAKNDVQSWFISQGMSSDGICNVPLTFYLNFNIKNEIGPEATSFSPLPDNC